MPQRKRYNDFNSALRSQFGCRVQKISLDAGLSCPNRDGTLSTGGCIYCNRRGSGTGAHERGLSIADQIASGKAFLSRRYKAKKFLAYFQSFSNTYAPVDTLKSLYDQALEDPDVVGMAVGTRPDCVDEAVLSLLGDYARRRLVWIEYGLQSAHDATLRAINRGHDLACFLEAVEMTRNHDIRICVHIILGLPGESRARMLETAELVSRLPVDGVKLHLLYVVKGTAMERLFATGAYACLSQEAYVTLVCDILALLPERMVIQRLTGDPHREELAAPLWALEKSATLSLIHEKMEKEDIWQGKNHRTFPEHEAGPAA